VTPLQLDLDEYRDDLAEFNLTEQQENELLEVLFNIMRTYVEIGFGLDSVQMFSGGRACHYLWVNLCSPLISRHPAEPLR